MCNSGLLTVQKAMLEANWKMFYIFKKNIEFLVAAPYDVLETLLFALIE